ncbi:hypothetical protein [Nonomuraea sp. NPDC005650]|uniref:hypothetical protein n=1 Tax=Nonomuraea sp. NPDC005650 TaxID=3157045 RepID=UPI0033AF81BF
MLFDPAFVRLEHAVLSDTQRRVPWRASLALVAAGALPLAVYAGWYAQHHGRFALSGSDGVALWARTMTFADCSIIEPPPDQAALCPNGTVLDAASEYVWDPRASLNRLPGDRFAHNDLARAFAMFLLVAPVAALDFDHRYVLPAIPVACVAAALALAPTIRGLTPGRVGGYPRGYDHVARPKATASGSRAS